MNIYKHNYRKNNKTISAINKKYYTKHKSKILAKQGVYYDKNKTNISIKHKRYYKKNVGEIKLRSHNYYVKNSDKIKVRVLQNQKDKPELARARVRKWKHKTNYDTVRLQSNIQARIAHNLRTRLRSAIHNNQKVGSAVRDLGCSIDCLKKRLEAKFQPGMSWLNYGAWHIDHVKPLDSFDLTDHGQFLRAVNYTNLQPLWKADNLRKGIKLAA